MGARRSIGLAFLVFAAACTPRGDVQAPAPDALSRDRGPNGWIAANYWGGLLSRTLEVSFEVEQRAYVLVGHLGGDGIIRVVFPYSAPIFGALADPVMPHRTIDLDPFYAQYDGAPEAYSFRMSPLRSAGARMTSYDGAGNGYVFLITSRTPLRYEIIQDGFEWLEVPVRNYENTTDPRRAIEQYALALTRGGRYTLKFATAFRSQGFASSAALAGDCALLRTLGLTRLGNFWAPLWAMDQWALEYQTRQGFGRFTCAMPHYASLDNFFFDDLQRQRLRRSPWPQWTPVVPTTTEPDPKTPINKRPTFRPFGERATTAGQSAISRFPTARRPGFGPSSTAGASDNMTRYTPRTFNPSRNPSNDGGGAYARGSGGASHAAVDRSPPARSPSATTSTPARTSTPSSTTPSSTTTPSTGTKTKQ